MSLLLLPPPPSPRLIPLPADVPSGSTTNGIKMQIYTCFTGNTNQQFTLALAPTVNDILPFAKGIVWKGHGECLDLTDSNLTDGAQVSVFGLIRFDSMEGRGGDGELDGFADAMFDCCRCKCGLVGMITIIRFGISSDPSSFDIPTLTYTTTASNTLLLSLNSHSFALLGSGVLDQFSSVSWTLY
jgi:hypothetical protein